ncbi:MULTISPECIES: HEPN domain-containing protein [Pseudanabaena]|uniref:HEPN domain-containing protein n=1 Tax=Pseudanabaena TaxID=1152 RepID=UPI002B1EA4B9|nr:HEPN domain-containing protein [Pseudanabaena sp. CCNP1317]
MESNRYRASISRAYYSMYFATQAILISENINASTHKGLIKLFRLHFIKTSKLSNELSVILGDTYDLRQLADYGEEVELTTEQVKITLQNAKDFLYQVRDYLNLS